MNSSKQNKDFTMVPNELFRDGSLSIKEIGLYSYLAYRSFGGNGISCYPSQKRMIKDLKMGSRCTLRKVLNRLVESNFLRIKKGSNYYGSSLYLLTKPKKEASE
ncbi:MAG: hypothetical protein CME62_14870 [Halobacteriovoraceae bacterium]|nr:hypothetical protein [Halobacteriovoraceae bacterium]